MGFPNPEESTTIYQREFPDAERQQIKLDILLLEGKSHVDIRRQFIAQRRLSLSAIKMYQKGILELSADEFEALASGITSKEIRDDIQALLTTSNTEEK